MVLWIYMATSTFFKKGEHLYTRDRWSHDIQVLYLVHKEHFFSISCKRGGNSVCQLPTAQHNLCLVWIQLQLVKTQSFNPSLQTGLFQKHLTRLHLWVHRFYGWQPFMCCIYYREDVPLFIIFLIPIV